MGGELATKIDSHNPINMDWNMFAKTIEMDLDIYCVSERKIYWCVAGNGWGQGLGVAGMIIT